MKFLLWLIVSVPSQYGRMKNQIFVYGINLVKAYSTITEKKLTNVMEYPAFTSLKSSTSRESKYLKIYKKVQKVTENFNICAAFNI